MEEGEIKANQNVGIEGKKKIIYVGESGDVLRRIQTNHCSGNVEASAFRKHVAAAMGYKIKKTKRVSGPTRVRIDLPNPRVGEDSVSNYIRSGEWRYVICNSHNEAKDFQWYVIDQLGPLLNRDRRPWSEKNLQRYQFLLAELRSSPAMNCGQFGGMRSGPGVYVFYHRQMPSNTVDRFSSDI